MTEENCKDTKTLVFRESRQMDENSEFGRMTREELGSGVKRMFSKTGRQLKKRKENDQTTVPCAE